LDPVSVSGLDTGTPCVCPGPTLDPRVCVRALHMDHVSVSGPYTIVMCLCQGLHMGHVSVSGPHPRVTCLCQGSNRDVLYVFVSGPYPKNHVFVLVPYPRVTCLCQGPTQGARVCVRVLSQEPHVCVKALPKSHVPMSGP
jgi:hypothetical protein